jgi:nucleoside-diphosphate-sugar epimerase
MPTVLVTGAAGFVGGYAVRAFVDEGWRVLALVHRSDSPALDALAACGQVEIVPSDVRDGDRLQRDVAGVLGSRRLDVVVHCAARTSDVGWARDFVPVNVTGVENVVALVARLEVPRLVHVSSTDVYGIRDFHGEREEELPLSRTERHPYARTKILGERVVRGALAPERWAIVRPGTIWGLDDPHVTKRVVDFLRWSPWIVNETRWRGRNRAPLSHVRNVAMALVLAAASNELAGRATNVLDVEHTTNDEFFALLGRAYFPGRRFGTLTVPTWIGMLFAAGVTAASNLVRSEQALMDPSHYSARITSSDLAFSGERFLAVVRQAGRRMVTRDEGLQELAARARMAAGARETGAARPVVTS